MYRPRDPHPSSPPASPLPGAVLVTGVSGFIGSTLAATLVRGGTHVVGLDAVGPEGPTSRAGHTRAAQNLAGLLGGPRFELVVGDLCTAELAGLLAQVDAVAHLAGRPGVQTSWGLGFRHHLEGNVLATQLLLEAALRAGVGRVVVASSSSVYGDVVHGRAAETAPPAPRSPYGVAKLAVEQLAEVYGARGLPVSCLRYFTVYGPRQRSDMAFHRIIRAALGGPPFELRGDGTQVRDVTHVDDAVRATVAALGADVPPGWVCNVGGGSPATLREAIERVEDLAGRPVPVRPVPPAPGDPARTAADLSRAERELGWVPTVGLAEGLASQLAWQQAQVSAPAPRPSGVPAAG